MSESPPSEPTPEPPTNIVPKDPNDNWPDFSKPAGAPAPPPAPPRRQADPGYTPRPPAPPSPARGPAYPQPYGRPGPPAQPGYPQPGYGQPGPGYPPPGYGGPGYGPGGPVPQGPVQPNDTNMAMLAHLGGIIFGFVPGLIVYLMKKDESPWARKQGAEALNFQLTLIIPTIICIVLTATVILAVIGIPLLIAINILRIVMCIMASTAASRGEAYEYPSWMRITMVS